MAITPQVKRRLKARYAKALAECKDSSQPVQALTRLKVLFQVFGLDLEDNEELAGAAGVNESALVDMLGRSIDQWWAQRLEELRAHCPRCGISVLPGSTCPHCGASLDGREGAALVRLSPRSEERWEQLPRRSVGRDAAWLAVAGLLCAAAACLWLFG